MMCCWALVQHQTRDSRGLYFRPHSASFRWSRVVACGALEGDVPRLDVLRVQGTKNRLCNITHNSGRRQMG